MVNGTTTGGAGGEVVTVTNATDFVEQISRTEPVVIYVRGTIDLQNLSSSPRVQSNKSLIGIGGNATIKNHGLVLWNVSNVIIRNLNFRYNQPDALTLAWGTNHVWIDHNDFMSDKGERKDPNDPKEDYYDGLIDITHGADYISISWNKFHHHDKVTLVGLDNKDEEYGKLQVTYYNNYFYDSAQRHPRLSWGRVHLLNNYYNSITTYGAASLSRGQIYAEGNVFENVTQPLLSHSFVAPPNNINGYITEKNNLYTNCGSNDITSPASFKPSDYYSYSALPPSQVKSLVTSQSGVGIIIVSLPSTTTSIPGDINGDGHVNLHDYNELVKDFGSKYTLFDYNNLIANYEE